MFHRLTNVVHDHAFCVLRWKNYVDVLYCFLLKINAMTIDMDHYFRNNDSNLSILIIICVFNYK